MMVTMKEVPPYIYTFKLGKINLPYDYEVALRSILFVYN